VYSPLGRGFFSTGPKLVESFSEGDYRKVGSLLFEYRVCDQYNTCPENNQLHKHNLLRFLKDVTNVRK
jgi:hypothetical protein